MNKSHKIAKLRPQIDHKSNENRKNVNRDRFGKTIIPGEKGLGSTIKMKIVGLGFNLLDSGKFWTQLDSEGGPQIMFWGIMQEI